MNKKFPKVEVYTNPYLRKKKRDFCIGVIIIVVCIGILYLLIGR